MTGSFVEESQCYCCQQQRQQPQPHAPGLLGVDAAVCSAACSWLLGMLGPEWSFYNGTITPVKVWCVEVCGKPAVVAGTSSSS
jgi:hypothetical protein